MRPAPMKPVPVIAVRVMAASPNARGGEGLG